MEAFFERLKRRKLVQWAIAYVAAAFALLQGIDIVANRFDWPQQAIRFVILMMIVGFFVMLVLAWYHGERGAQRVTGTELLILALLLAIGGGFLWRFSGTSREPKVTSSSAVTIPKKSIAVLPLVNTSGDPANEYFSDGLSEELIAVLARIPDLKVIGRNSSFLFKGKSSDSAAIGEKLGVAHLIEGSVRKQGDRVRIVAELINAADGRSIWSETYDRRLKDVFAVQAEIATSVAEQMKVKLLGESVPSVAAGTSENPAAHNAVLQADFYLQQESAETVRRAITFLQEAIRLDPNYALAYAKLAAAWRRYAASFSTEVTDDTAKAYAQARSAADMAVSLAPDLNETRMAVGLLAMNPNLDFPAAEKEFRRVVESAPSDAAAKNGLSMALSSQGRLSEAERTCREVISLDPLLTTSWYNIGRVAVGLGNYKDAEELFHKGLEIQPHASRFHSYLVILDILQNRRAEALANAQLESEGFWRDYALNLVQQTKSDRPAADAMLKDFITRYSNTGAFQIAVLYAVRKQPDEMFKWLDTAYAIRDSGLTQLAVTPFFLPYVNDPRFAALGQKLNVQLPSASAKQ
jgi:serine/threonine-protein kinase